MEGLSTNLPSFNGAAGYAVVDLKKKLAASSMLHEAKIAYYAFDVIVYCMYTHQTRIAYTKQTNWIAYTKRIRRHIVCK